MKRILTALLLAFCLPAAGASRITATVTVTNLPVAGEVLTVNGNTRTWATNGTSTQILLGTNTLQANTNLWLHIGANPFSGLTVLLFSTNQVQLIGLPGASLLASMSTNWAAITYTTNTVTNTTVVAVPLGVFPQAQRTNIASQLAQDLESYSPTAFGTNSTLLSRYMNLETVQTVTGAKTFSSITTTGLVNRGSAVSSEGSGTDSEQFGTGAQATNTQSLAVGASALAGSSFSIAIGNAATALTKDGATAIGNAATATGEDSAAIGSAASATGTNSLAVGNGAQASSSDSTAVGTAALASGTDAMAIGAASEASNDGIAVGSSSVATGVNSMAIGQQASATHQNAVAIGYQATSTASNQIVLGGAAQLVKVAGMIEAGSITNATYHGTLGTLSGGTISSPTLTSPTINSGTLSNTTLNGTASATGLRLPENLHTTLVNGANSGVVLTNTFNRIDAGPTGAFTIHGVAGGADGRMLILYNATGQNMTIAHQSGSEATAGNRIITMTGADVATTGNGSVILIYDSNASRWILIASEL